MLENNVLKLAIESFSVQMLIYEVSTLIDNPITLYGDYPYNLRLDIIFSIILDAF